MVEAHPLHWPPGWPRTHSPERSRFGSGWNRQHSVGSARDFLLHELRRLGATNVVISTNVPVKLDGNPYSSAKEPGDSGVAVYFDLNGQNRCYPIDRWDRVADNLWAIAKSIEALRGLDRWGAKNSIEAAFTGFLALPGPTVTAIRYFDACVDEDDVVATRRKLVKELHPDAGGDADKFAEMERQFKEITRKGRVNR